jgi:hypothetical protein
VIRIKEEMNNNNNNRRTSVNGPIAQYGIPVMAVFSLLASILLGILTWEFNRFYDAQQKSIAAINVLNENMAVMSLATKDHGEDIRKLEQWRTNIVDPRLTLEGCNKAWCTRLDRDIDRLTTALDKQSVRLNNSNERLMRSELSDQEHNLRIKQLENYLPVKRPDDYGENYAK